MKQQLVLLRHGQSQWNVEQRFTGSTDVPLTALGVEEARRAGVALRDAGFAFDLVFTSALSRAQETARQLLRAMGARPEVRSTPLLNERSFGVLEGMRFAEAAARFGPEWGEPWLWGLRPQGGESLDDLLERVRPCWEQEIRPALEAARRVLVVAHGNTIRALDELLRNGAGERLDRVPTAQPILYSWNGDGSSPTRNTLAVSAGPGGASTMA